MGGIGFLLVIFIYIAGSRALVAKASTLKYKIVALLAILLIPTADAIYGRIKLHQMCEADGGLKVYQVAHDVEGYMNGWAEPDKYVVEDRGYKFAESKEKYGVCNRISMQDGQLVIEKDVKPKSKYKAYIAGQVTLNKSYWYRDAIIETYPEGEVMVRDRMYSFKGGWAERFLGGFSDAGADTVRCEMRGLNPQELVLNYLKTGDK